MQPVATPAAPAICGEGCMAPCIALGAISPKARLPRNSHEMTTKYGIQSACVIANNTIADAAASARPTLSG
jgi:hypothetical protein